MMRITKFEHANFVVEAENKRLVVDPGSFTRLLDDAHDVVAIVVTHEHPDHWTPEQLSAILANNSDAKIFAPQGAATAIGDDFDVTVVADGDTAQVGPFSLAFYGAKHAVIHASIPVVNNVGVLINSTIFYPGDSYTVPPVSVDVLAIPSSAPWLKIGEAMDYVLNVRPKRGFPTHEMVNSDAGKSMANQRLASMVESGGGEYFPLTPGDTLEL
jgi:L-ascorbate metabolism protein UlaG (beta-lactamase superfamily)